MSKINEIIFVNFFHYGDIHLSRGFVKKISEAFPNLKFGYAHKKDKRILADLPKVRHVKMEDLPKMGAGFGAIRRGSILYLNTWYNSYSKQFNTSGPTFDTLYSVFSCSLKSYLNKDIVSISQDPKDFFPEIDFGYYKIDKAKEYLDKCKFDKKVLVSNCAALSGQAVNFTMSPIIKKMAGRYPNYLFIYTNNAKDIKPGKNFVPSSSIIGYDLKCDLNENAYISTRCDAIIGRSSGAYTFAMNKENMFNQKKLMLSFSSIGRADNNYWLGPGMSKKIKYSSRIVNYSLKDCGRALKKVEEEIKCHLK